MLQAHACHSMSTAQVHPIDESNKETLHAINPFMQLMARTLLHNIFLAQLQTPETIFTGTSNTHKIKALQLTLTPPKLQTYMQKSGSVRPIFLGMSLLVRGTFHKFSKCNKCVQVHDKSGKF